MGVDRRNQNRKWKTIDDLWKEAFDNNIPALTVTQHPHSRDAFGRLRVSGTGNRLDVEFIYDKQDDFFDETTTNGTVTHNANSRDLTLSLADANDGSFAKMASYPVPYTPGSSQLIDITGVLDLAGLGGGQAEFFVRSSVSGSATETIYPQADWNNTPSDIDWSMSHIFSIDFQSLKVGTIRAGLVQSGTFIPVMQVNNDNLRNTGYWQLANGSAYWHLYTTGGNTYMELGYGNESNAIGFRYVVTANASATMKAICCTVKSEGGSPLFEMAGLPRSASNQQTPRTAGTTIVPILSIRPRATFNSLPNLGLCIPKSWQIQTTQPARIVLLHDATLTGASWNNVETNDSMMEYDVAATAITGGHIVDEIYVATAGTGSNSRGSSAGSLGKTLMWDRQDSVSGILTVAAIRTGGTNASLLATTRWEEIR